MRVRHFFTKRKLVIFAVSLILVPVLTALLAPLIAPRGPLEQDYSRILRTPGPTDLFGTDEFGRCVLSRVIWGSRPALTIAFLSVAIGGSIGVVLGLIAGYFQGTVDVITNRVVDGLLAFPAIIVAIAALVVFGGGTVPLIVAIALPLVPRFARVVRGGVLTLRSQDFVQAARSIGASNWRVLFRHVFPNTISLIIVYTAMRIPLAIFVESSLSYLGMGVSPDAATWGRIVADGSQYLQIAPWISFFPGFFIAITAIGCNLFGDCLRDMLDPKFAQ